MASGQCAGQHTEKISFPLINVMNATRRKMVVDPRLFPVEKSSDLLIVLREIQERKITLLCHQVRIIKS